jgi:hypothetical protein
MTKRPWVVTAIAIGLALTTTTLWLRSHRSTKGEDPKRETVEYVAGGFGNGQAYCVLMVNLPPEMVGRQLNLVFTPQDAREAGSKTPTSLSAETLNRLQQVGPFRRYTWPSADDVGELLLPRVFPSEEAVAADKLRIVVFFLVTDTGSFLISVDVHPVFSGSSAETLGVWPFTLVVPRQSKMPAPTLWRVSDERKNGEIGLVEFVKHVGGYEKAFSFSLVAGEPLNTGPGR